MPIFFLLSSYPQIIVYLRRKIKKNTQNSFVLKTFQATKFNLHKVYIHIFTEECSHTGMEETFNWKIHFIFEVFKKSG